MEKVLSASASTPVKVPLGLDEIYEKYRLELSRYVAATCRCGPMEVEDIVQTAFMRLQAKFEVSEIANPKAFLYKTAHNIAIDMLRHQKVQDEYARNEGPATIQVDNQLGPDREVEGRQRLSLIANVLWRMPAKRRELLLMNRCENLSYAEIARRIGISEAAVRKHVSKALHDCHKALHP